MKVTVHLLSAFGLTENGGNPAGVVLEADGLNDMQKKDIAKFVGYSETAFVQKSKTAHFKVTFFTSEGEVDLCGHATIATYSLMFQKKLVPAGIYAQEVKAGTLPIEIKSDGTIIMDQTLPVFSEEISVSDMADILRVSADEISDTGMNPQIVSTGLRDIIMPLIDRKTLFDINPDFQKMSMLNKQTNSIGVHAFTLDTIKSSSTAHCRNFAPLYGIDEEAATGSANGALASYLFRNNKINKTDIQNLVFEQGYSMNRISEIIGSLKVSDGKITRVRVGGKALRFGKKIFMV